MTWTTIISPETLVRYLGQKKVSIVDCRFFLTDTEAGRDDYTRSHIPGARYAHLDEDLSGPVISGMTGRHPLPNPDRLGDVLSKLGISNDTQVVAYDDSGGAIAARLWWLLNWVGHHRVAVLDGGWSGWVKEGLPVTSDTSNHNMAFFQPASSTTRVATTKDVERMEGESSQLLVDSRAAIRYRGEEELIDPVAGHIPWAVSSPWEDNLDESGRFRSVEELRSRYERLFGGIPAKDIVFHCGSGVTAVHNIIAVQHSGLGQAGLYVGSWSEWIADPDRPITHRTTR